MNNINNSIDFLNNNFISYFNTVFIFNYDLKINKIFKNYKDCYEEMCEPFIPQIKKYKNPDITYFHSINISKKIYVPSVEETSTHYIFSSTKKKLF